VAIYEGGCFKFHSPNVVVTTVDDMDNTARLLAALRIVGPLWSLLTEAASALARTFSTISRNADNADPLRPER
jgi:hypothetical protein